MGRNLRWAADCMLNKTCHSLYVFEFREGIVGWLVHHFKWLDCGSWHVWFSVRICHSDIQITTVMTAPGSAQVEIWAFWHFLELDIHFAFRVVVWVQVRGDAQKGGRFHLNKAAKSKFTAFQWRVLQTLSLKWIFQRLRKYVWGDVNSPPTW